ncbi:hypothetical protein VPH35_063136 [Triticum aestivum]
MALRPPVTRRTNEVTHHKPAPTSESSRRFLSSYTESLICIKQNPKVDFSKGKMVVDIVSKLSKLSTVARKVGEQVEGPWCLPPSGSEKLNVDGAFKQEESMGGAGMLLQNDTGAIIFSLCRFLRTSWVKLTLFCDASRKVYWAGHNSIRFFVHEPKQETYRFLRKTTLGGVSADDTKDPMKSTASLYSFLVAVDIMFFPVGLARHMFVTNVEGSIYVFKNEIGKLVALDSINNYAIFIGHQRSLAIDADKFPGIEANCVYYTDILGSSAHICKCNIKDRKVERISEAAEFVKRGKQFVLVADRPSTIIHLLSSYTINIPESQLALQQIQ